MDPGMCISMWSVWDHLDKPKTAMMGLQFTIQMQRLADLPCEKKPHLQSIPLKRRSLVLACVPQWLFECQALPSSFFFLRLSSVTGILGWIIRITLLLLKNTRS